MACTVAEISHDYIARLPLYFPGVILITARIEWLVFIN